MMKMFLSLMLILFSIIMLFISHPLSMGLLIMIQTLLLSMMSGMMINTYWFSYILFLIFLGGLLVLFIYVSSIASNEMFKFSMFNLFLPMMLFMILLISFNLKNNLNWMNFNFNEEMNYFFMKFIFFNNENKINLTKLYNNYNYYLMLLLIIYLFITLIAVVKITNIFFGPLRSNFNF